MPRSSQARQPQAAEPSDFEADLVAVLVVPALADESEDVDEAESEDELVDSLEDAWPPVVPEPLCWSLPELAAPRPELLPRRESLRESLR